MFNNSDFNPIPALSVAGKNPSDYLVRHPGKSSKLSL